MRTLDEVIEIASDWTNGFDEMSIEKQMLHYLKMYRSDQIQWEADREDWRDKWESYIEARKRHLDAVKELKRNDPLTWDELKMMEGKPVWVEWTGSPRWGIVDGIYKDAFGVENLVVCVPHDYLHFDKRMQGDLWQAYRKERS